MAQSKCPMVHLGALWPAVLVSDARSREEDHPGHESCGQCNLNNTPEPNRRRGRPTWPNWARTRSDKSVGRGAPSYSNSPEAAKKIEVKGAERFRRHKTPNTTGDHEQRDRRGVPKANAESPVGIPPDHCEEDRRRHLMLIALRAARLAQIRSRRAIHVLDGWGGRIRTFNLLIQSMRDIADSGIESSCSV